MAETTATVFLHVRPATEVTLVEIKNDRPDSYALHIGPNVSVLGSAADLQRIAGVIDAGPADDK